jgi:heptosyltransferase-2
VRRWPEPFFREIVERIRKEFDVAIALVPDPDGYGTGLAGLADLTFATLDLPGLLTLLRRSSVLLCNDSGPGHLAAALGCPVIALFGPTDPDWFRPWGNEHHVVIRDICPWRPCFDYCKFAEPICMTRLKPEVVWPEIRAHLSRQLTMVSQCNNPTCAGECAQA